MKIIDAVIIDDEAPAREMLKTLLSEYFNHIRVIGEADSVQEGVQVLKKCNPAVVFLDINLSDGSGFNLLEKLDNVQFQIIFVTAYNSYAINAFKVNALDYILKPIGLSELERAIERLNETSPTISENDLPEIVANWRQQNNDQSSKLAIREFDGVRFIQIGEIIRCRSHNNYTEFHMMSGEKIMTSKTLKEYAKILESYNFFRIYQSHLVNLLMVKKILSIEGLYVEMNNGDVLELSRDKKKNLFEKMKKLQA